MCEERRSVVPSCIASVSPLKKLLSNEELPPDQGRVQAISLTVRIFILPQSFMYCWTAEDADVTDWL